MANLTIEQLTSFTGTPQNTDLIIIHDGNNAKKITYAELLTKIFSGSTQLVATGDTFSLTGHIIPTSNATYDLGSAEYKFRSLYLHNSTMYLGETAFSETNVEDSMEIKNISVPTSPTSEGNKGDVVFDDNFMYVCISQNSWRRINIETSW